MTPETIVTLIVLVWVAFALAVVRACVLCAREKREQERREAEYQQWAAKYTKPAIPQYQLDELARERWID